MIVVSELRGAWAKLRQAQAHAIELFDRLDAIYEERPLPLEQDGDSYRWVVRAPDLSMHKLEIAIRLGDVLHNLRSVLEHIAYQCVLLEGATPTRR